MEKKKNVFWIGMTSLFSDISSEMIFSLLPLFLSAIGISRAMIGLIEGIAESTASILKVVSGWVSDKLQARKGLVVVGYSISAIVKPLIALANTWYQVVAVRFADRVGKGLRNPPRDALIADSVQENERGRAFGFQQGMDTTGAVIGTLLASFLLYILGRYTNLSIVFQYRTIFWLSLIPSIFTVLIVSFMVKDVKAKEFVKSETPTNWKNLDSGFRSFLLVSAIFQFSNFSYALFILRANNMGVIAALIPIIYLVYNIIYSSLSQPLGVLADKIGKRNILFLGFALSSIMSFGFAVLNHPIYAWLLFAIYGVVSAVTNMTPRAMVADYISSELRGTAYGIYYMVIGLIALPTSAIAGLLWDRFGAEIPFLYGALIAGISAALVLLLIPRRPKLTKKI
ncbi:MFS transporter [Candidatus Saganbacteria bacterium]|nr:MFS transporter [Candidatus Saganbacteria bacterium]